MGKGIRSRVCLPAAHVVRYWRHKKKKRKKNFFEIWTFPFHLFVYNFSSQDIWLCYLGYWCYKPFKGQLIARAAPRANYSTLPLHNIFLSPSASHRCSSSTTSFELKPKHKLSSSTRYFGTCLPGISLTRVNMGFYLRVRERKHLQ